LELLGVISLVPVKLSTKVHEDSLV